YKFLTTKTWIDRHHQNQVKILHHVLQHRYRRMGIDGYTRLYPQIPDLLNVAMQMRTGFIMNGDDLCAGFGKLGYKIPWIFNHQMNNHGFFKNPPYLYHDHH